MKYLLLIVSLLCTTVNADSLYLGGWSFHPSPSDEVNNSNHMMVVYERSQWFVGTFKNSYSDQTYALGREFIITESEGPLDLSILVGVSHGYKECYGPGDIGDEAKACFLVAPNIRFKNKSRVKPSILFFGGAVIATARIDW